MVMVFNTAITIMILWEYNKGNKILHIAIFNTTRKLIYIMKMLSRVSLARTTVTE